MLTERGVWPVMTAVPSVAVTRKVAPPRRLPWPSTFFQRSEPATNVLTASPDEPCVPSVARFTVTAWRGPPPSGSGNSTEAVAWPVTVPAEFDVNVTWNWPLLLVVPEIGPAGLATAPPLLVKVTVTLALL